MFSKLKHAFDVNSCTKTRTHPKTPLSLSLISCTWSHYSLSTLLFLLRSPSCISVHSTSFIDSLPNSLSEKFQIFLSIKAPRMVKLASVREIRQYGRGLARNRSEFINSALYVFATVLLLCGFVAFLVSKPKPSLVLRSTRGPGSHNGGQRSRPLRPSRRH